ncbi:MAG TPA: hypothetical protein VF881_16705 [Polyangiaceae bacterium]
MLDFYFTLIVSILNIAVPYGITRYDRARLDREQLARAWNGPSWACAVYFFGPLSLPAHFWVTRRTVGGFFLGTLWTLAVFACEWLIGVTLEHALA